MGYGASDGADALGSLRSLAQGEVHPILLTKLLAVTTSFTNENRSLFFSNQQTNLKS